MEGDYEVEGSQTTSAAKTTSRTSGTKRWTPSESRFFIRFMASQAEQGLKVDKGFKPQAIHGAIRAMKDTFGVTVTEMNVCNHLRTIRRRWVRIKKLKEMSGMGWDDKNKMIIIGEAEYLEYIKIHTQDEPYLNKPIEDHDLLEIICGNDQATGHRAIQSGSHIGEQMDYNTEPEELPPVRHFDDTIGEASAHGNASPFNQGNNSEPMSTTSPTPKRKDKGKRKANTSDDAIRELASTIRDAFVSVRSSRSVSFAKELQDECVKLTQCGYSVEEAVMVYEHLMADDARARTFFAMCEEFRKVWVNRYFASFGRDF